MHAAESCAGGGPRSGGGERALAGAANSPTLGDPPSCAEGGPPRTPEPMMRRPALLAVAMLALPAALAAQGRRPTLPPPSITEYQPRSTLVVPEHPVPRAKFPAVDLHGHPPTLDNPAAIAQVLAAMDALNLQVMVQARGSSGARLTQQIEAVRAAGHADRFVFFTTLNLRDVGPGSGARIAAQLEEGRSGGGRGNPARSASSSGSTRERPTAAACSSTIPNSTSSGKPRPAWASRSSSTLRIPRSSSSPLDYENERWLEMAIFPNRRFFDRSRYPSFEELMAERDRMLAKHPNTTWVLAHMGWHTQDLGRLGELFDRFPNVHGEVGAVLYDLGRQPRFGHEFFVRYQDRILFGKDSFQPEEYPYYWRVFETGRVLRLLPGLPRLLEALRHGASG